MFTKFTTQAKFLITKKNSHTINSIVEISTSTKKNSIHDENDMSVSEHAEPHAELHQ